MESGQRFGTIGSGTWGVKVFGLEELISDDFQHNRLHGRTRALNPFASV